MKNWTRKCFIFLCTINFEVTWPFWKMCHILNEFEQTKHKTTIPFFKKSRPNNQSYSGLEKELKGFGKNSSILRKTSEGFETQQTGSDQCIWHLLQALIVQLLRSIKVLGGKSERDVFLKASSGIYFSFLVVRHPLLRLLSAYVDRILRPESYQSRYYVPRVFQNVKVGVKHFIKKVKH